MYSLYFVSACLAIACSVTAHAFDYKFSCPSVAKVPSLDYPTCASSTLDGSFWFLQILGFGSASSVLKARWKSQTPQYLPRTGVASASPVPEIVAIKVFDRQSDGEMQGAYSQSIRNEVDLLMALDHPNIVIGYELLPQRDRFLAVMEYCPLSLEEILEEHLLEEEEQDRVLGSVFMALRYLHQKGIAHRDIKLQNILVCENDTVKMADLGSALRFRDHFGRTLFTKEIEGTEVYLAPETLVEPIAPYRADLADVWQLGILCVAVLLRRFPWEMAMVEDSAFKAFEGDSDTLLTQIPSRAREVVRRMLVPRPDERISLDDAWEDEWVRSTVKLARGP